MGRACGAFILIGAISFFPALAEEVEMRYGGVVRFEQSGLKIAPVAFKAPGWTMFEGVEGSGDADFSFRLSSPEMADVAGSLTLEPAASNAVRFSYSFAPRHDVELSSLGLFATFPINGYLDATILLEDASATVPDVPTTHPAGELISGQCRRVRVRRQDGAELGFRFDAPVFVRVRDQRRTRGYGNLVVWIEVPHTRHYEVGRAIALSAVVTCPDDLTCRGKSAGVKIVRGSNWIPFVFESDVLPGSTLDFIDCRGTGMPAGCHGRVFAHGRDFVFADSPDVPRRFYGVNLCNDANFPATPEDARKLAARLARCGYNAVRFHHYDAPMVSKSVDGLTVNREMQRRFDSLVAACIEYGLYMTTDLYVSRWIALPAVGRNQSALMPNADFKSLVYVDEKVFANYLAFSRELLGHVNCYTKRRLCDEPALAWICLVNEGNLGNDMERYRKHPEWRDAWRDWLAEERPKHAEWTGLPDTIPSSCVDGSAAAQAFAAFLADRERAFVARMRAFLRDELKCGALISNMNFGYGVHPETFRDVRARDYDYVDEHYYYDHPLNVFAGRSLPMRVTSGTNPLRGGPKAAVDLGDRQVADKPYTVTEFNWCWPGTYRSACGPAVAARAVSRNWAGLWRFDWSDDIGGVTNAAEKALGAFNLAGDALAQISDRASVNLFLRGDLYDPQSKISFDQVRGALTIDTPNTVVAAASGGRICAGCLEADLGSGFATVWASAADARPLAESRRILVAHLTDLQNEGDEFSDDSLSVLKRRGVNGRLMRAGRTEVSLTVGGTGWRVWALSMSGRRQRIVPAACEGGRLRFVADVAARPDAATFLYELVRPEAPVAPAVRPFADNERVVFLGDSITHLGRYLGYLQLFQSLRHPGSGVRLINGGIAGDVAKGGVDRLDCDVFARNADRVFVMFGMNDVGRENYATTNPTPVQVRARAESLSGYESHLRRLVGELVARHVETVLMTPTPYDQYTVGTGECLAACNESGLASAAACVRTVAADGNMGIVDLHGPFTALQKLHGDFKFCPDRVHPGPEGGLLMAAHVLTAMRESPLVASVELAPGIAVASVRASVTNVAFASDGVSFDYAPKALPFPPLPEYAAAEKFFPLTDRLNREMIRVCGLRKGNYSLFFDRHKVGVFSAAEFAAGVNVASCDTPNRRRAQDAVKPMYEWVALTELLRDYEIAAKWVRDGDRDPADAAAADVVLDAFLTAQAGTPHVDTFRHWIDNYRDVRQRKFDLDERAEALLRTMATVRPLQSRVSVVRIENK